MAWTMVWKEVALASEKACWVHGHTYLPHCDGDGSFQQRM